MIRTFFLGIAGLLLAMPLRSIGQELNCDVTVRTEQIEKTNQQVFETLEKSIWEFMNNRNWTDQDLKNNERINCKMVINIKEKNNDEFKAALQVRSSRPVYGTSYNSTIFNYQDNDFDFQYVEYDPLDYVDGTYTSNLTSLLAYYAYLIIGLDFDTFSEMGGTNYLQKAESVVNSAQNSDYEGWQSAGSTKNRYVYVNQILDSRFQAFRKAMYVYHRKGLDGMSEKTEQGRKKVFESIQQLQQVHKKRPNTMIMSQFFQAKSDEIANIFSKGDASTKNQVLEILRKLDPSNYSKYQDKIRG